MIGRKISNFHINECIGEGGMGTVYKATDMHLERTVAIKMLHPHMMKHPDAFKRFRNEAQLSARVSHPNVATLFDFQQTEGYHYIVMEFVDGQPLDKLLKLQEKLPETEAIKITLQILEGLTAAHELGIMHRDLKPGNIMINKRGFVKLMDFGIARLEHAERMTRQNSVIGTLEYLAPELVKGAAPSKRSDLYAVGVMLFEMLAGRTLFEGDTEASLMYNIAHTQAAIKLPGVDRRLVQIIKKLTHKQAARRYQTTGEVAQDLEKIHPGGKIDTLLLHQKVLPTSKPSLPSLSPIQKVFSLQKFPTLPKLSIPALDQLKMPFDLDIRIIAVAIGLSLFILFLGTNIGSDATQDSEEGMADINMQDENLLANEANNDSRSFLPARQPVEVKVGEWEAGETDNPPTGKPIGKKKAPKRPNKKHQIRQIDEGPTDGQSESGTKPPRRVSQSDPTNSPKSGGKESLRIQIPETFIAASFNEKISTETHQVGQTFFLKANQSIRVKNQLVVQKGARLKAKITKLRKGAGKKKALLVINPISVQAVNGDWLPLAYREYNNSAKDKVELPRGFQLNKIRLEPTSIRLNK